MANETVNLGSSLLDIGKQVIDGVVEGVKGGVNSLLTGANRVNGFSAGKIFNQKYNELTHKVEFWLDNSGDLKDVAQNVFPINPAAILQLNINNNLLDWVVDGSMIFMFMPEDAPDSQQMNLSQKIKTFIQGAMENAETLKTFQFRGDGYDLLRVSIVPITKGGEHQSGDSLNITEGDPKWCISHLFSIYEIFSKSSLK